MKMAPSMSWAGRSSTATGPHGHTSALGGGKYWLDVMRTARAQCTATFGANGHLYVGGGGGIVGDDDYSNMDELNASGVWTAVPGSDGRCLARGAMIAHGPWIILAGGVSGWTNGTRNVVKSALVVWFDTRTGIFHHRQPLATPRCDHCIAVLGGNLVVVGGGPPEVLRPPPLAHWTIRTTHEHTPKFREALGVVTHIFARTDTLPPDCISLIMQCIDPMAFDAP